MRLTIGQHDADGLYPFGLQPCQQSLKVDRGHDIIGHHRNLLAQQWAQHADLVQQPGANMNGVAALTESDFQRFEMRHTASRFWIRLLSKTPTP